MGELNLMEDFTFGTGTGSGYSCSAVINGLMMIFGGSDSAVKQISIVESCWLRRLGELPMEFFEGACNTFETIYDTQEVFLCFAYEGENTCHR